jgi:hypothetical protein
MEIMAFVLPAFTPEQATWTALLALYTDMGFKHCADETNEVSIPPEIVVNPPLDPPQST